MSNRRILTCAITIFSFFSAPTSATAGPEARCDLKMLVKAIDIPLSVKSLQICSATVDDLLAMVYDHDEAVYTRGRAVFLSLIFQTPAAKLRLGASRCLTLSTRFATKVYAVYWRSIRARIDRSNIPF